MDASGLASVRIDSNLTTALAWLGAPYKRPLDPSISPRCTPLAADMASNSGLTGWLESRALQHKKHHENILGEQKYPGLRLMFLKVSILLYYSVWAVLLRRRPGQTVGPYEVQSDGQMMWFEMADKDHRINVVIPGLVVREFNS